MSSNYTLTQKAIAEFLGTFSILFFGVGSVIIEFLTVPDSVEYGTYVLNGLGHGALGWTGIAIAHLFAVGIPIYLFGRVSGAHINPAVTIALWATKRIDSITSAVYIVSQILGATIAGILFVLVRGTVAATIGGMGATAPFPGVTVGQAFLVEFIITFFLMFGVMAFAVDSRAPENFAGFGIASIIAMGVFATGNISGASFNPARSLGPYIVNTIYGGPDLWGVAWIYILAPTLGAIAAVYFYDQIFLNSE